MAAVGGDPEVALALGPDTVELHELLDPFLAHPDAPYQQLSPGARPAVSAVRLGVD
jgi:hypothetical protein